jgi:hypothetical protein
VIQGSVGTDREVEAWFRGYDHPLKDASPTFVFEMFHLGASLPGTHPRLEGRGGTVRYMRFDDLDDVNAKRSDLETAVRAWVRLRSGRS